MQTYCRRPVIGIGIALLIGQAGLLTWNAGAHSPTLSEPLHLAAGVSHWEFLRFDLFRVNPPLVRSVATLPVLVADPPTDWSRYDSNPVLRRDALVGNDFWRVNGRHAFTLLTWARWACIPFSLLGAVICFCWARDLYGCSAGIAALVLWCFSPCVLGHASLITPDIHAAAMGLAAGYTFWLWLGRPSWQRALAAGFVLGLAELSKSTLVVFYPLWLVLWILYRSSVIRHLTWRQRFRESVGFLLILISSLTVLNAGYAFEGSFQPLGRYHFKSRLLGGPADAETRRVAGTNRFTETWLGAVPLPLPKNYVQGMDRQRWDLEKPERSYLQGEWKSGGWWYYYLVGLAVKVPLGTWVLILLATVLYRRGGDNSVGWRDETILLLPVVAILILVSSQTSFSRHLRYVFPVLPFLFVWSSRIFRSSTQARHWGLTMATTAALCWSAGSSLWAYPHNLSYFNELAGGPTRGHAVLIDSSIGWGQDLFYLKHWVDEHPNAAPLHLASYGLLDPRTIGIDFTLPPVGPAAALSSGQRTDERWGPQPGWYAIDANFLRGSDLPMADAPKHWGDLTDEQLNLCYFLNFEPVAMAGYSICIYHITSSQANRVRRELGLPELPTGAG